MKKIIVFLSAIVFCFSCGSSSDQEVIVNKALRPVKYAEIIASGGEEVHTFSGVAQADQQSNLSFRVAGTVRDLNIKLGDRIKKGQLIATLDPVDYNIQAEQASASQKGSEANLKSSENQLLIAKSNYQRIEKLYENNSVPLSEFEQAKSNYETAQSQFEAAQTQVLSAEKQTQSALNQVKYTRLTAPFSGVITAVNIEENELVASGTPIAVLSSEKHPEVNVGIPENFIARIKKGQQVDIQCSVLPGQKFKGTVQEVSFAAGNTPTYPAIVSFDNPSAEIRPGMAATVTFYLGKLRSEKFLMAPIKAIGNGVEGDFAFVLKQAEDGAYQVEKRKVNVGELLPGGFEIKEGLNEGELVAIAGLKSLLNGMKVSLIEDN